MTIMECRFANLQSVINGFSHTQVPLVLFDGTNLLPFVAIDDIGIYVVIPKLVRLFGISLSKAINLFFYTLLFASFFLALVGLFLFYQSAITRLTSALTLSLLGGFLFIMRNALGDVCLMYLVSGLAIVPLFLYFMYKNTSSSLFYFYLFFTGTFLGTLHYIRAYSGLGTLVFIVTLLLIHAHVNIRKALLLFGLLGAGFACPVIYFTSVIQEYQHYAQQHFPEYEHLSMQHPFWHQAYIGFGFLKWMNDDNIRYEDSFGEATVKSCNPNVTTTQTTEYEAILKEKTLLLFKKQPFFVYYTLFAKLGVLLLFLLIFAHSGLLAALFFPKPWYIELAFFLGLAANAIFPVLAMPFLSYSLGFIAFATLYGVISINNALLSINFKNIRNHFRNKIFTKDFIKP